MKIINQRFTKKDIDCIKSIIGKKLSAIRHDEFFWGDFSTGKVSFYIDGHIYQLKLEEKPVDYLWGEEGVSIFSFLECKEEDTKTVYTGENAPKYLLTPVNETIKDVQIIEDTVKAFNENGQFGELTYTAGIIIELESKKYCFWKEVYFEDDIHIAKGQNPEKKIPSVDSLWNDWAPGCHSENSRSIIQVSKERKNDL